jgi:uncharacterized integral membrane protein
MTATSVEPDTSRHSSEPPAAPTARAPAGEPRGKRFARQARRARLYVSAGAFVALLVLLVLLASENTHPAKVNWVVGSGRASLAWILAAAAVFGWLLGITTAVVVRRRTRLAH